MRKTEKSHNTIDVSGCYLSKSAVWLVIMTFFLSACNLLQIDSLSQMPKSTVMPTDSTSLLADTKSNTNWIGVCYIYIRIYDEHIGGIPTQLESMYVARDGTIQQTLEMSNDTILALQKGEVDVANLFDKLTSIHFPSTSNEEIRSSGEGLVLPEHAESTLFVEVSSCDADVKKWVGSSADVSPSIRSLVEDIKNMADKLEYTSVASGRKYIRSQSLEPAKIEQLRRAGLIIDASQEQLESAPLLRRAIECEHRLIDVSSDETLYGDISSSFEYGKSTHIAREKQVFQIRHLIVE